MDQSRTEGRAKSAAAETPTDLQSLLTVGGNSLAGLGAGFLALFGPTGSDLSVALTIVTLVGGLGVLGAAGAVAAFAARR